VTVITICRTFAVVLSFIEDLIMKRIN